MRFTRFRRTTATGAGLLLAAALLAAGCGSDGRLSEQEYIEENNKIQKRMAKSTEKLSGDAANDPDALAAQFGVVREDLKEASSDFNALEPPEQWEDEHEVIVTSLEDTADVMTKLQAAAKKQDTKALTATFAELTEIQARYRTAVDSINKQ